MCIRDRYGHDGTFWKHHPNLTYRPVAWTVWNEPNLPRYWGGPAQPGVFARFLEYTSDALREVDPQGEIIAGGLFCQGPWKAFLSQFYLSADKSSYDAIAVHPYNEQPFGVYRIVRGARNIMDRAGDDAELWIDEISWGTEVRQHRFTKTPKKQAKNMRILFQLLETNQEALNLGKVLWYGFRDDPESNICHFCASSGLWFEGGKEPKPAWFVYKGFGAEPGSAISGRVVRRNRHPLAGQDVYLDLNKSRSYDDGEPLVTTGDNGRFKFKRLYPTKYLVRVDPSKDKACSRPRNCTLKAKVASGKAKRKQTFFVAKAKHHRG